MILVNVLVYLRIQELQTLQQEVQNYNYTELDLLMELLILLLLLMILLDLLNLKVMMQPLLQHQQELIRV